MRSKDPIIARWGMKSLSQKLRYDKFVDLYMLTGDANGSYRQCFKGESKEAIRQSAYKLVRHRYVVYEINRKSKIINQKMEKKIIMKRERILQELEEILMLTKGKERYSDALKALDQVSKITGAYSPVKSEVEHKEITINYITPDDIDENID